MHDRTIVLHGRRFHYTDWGRPTSPPAVLLHGITGHARTWDDEAALLAERFRVLALDQRGHGDSDPAPDGDYSDPALLGDLAAFVDALHLPPFTVLALSLGGRVAINYAGRHPARVERLVVVDIGPEIAPAGRARVGMLMAAAPDRALRDAIRQGRLRVPADLWPQWHAIQCPALLVRGAESDVLSPETAKRMVDELPHARLVVVPGAGHTVPGDQPAAFHALLREFLMP